MKVALCYSGLIRTFKTCFPNHLEKLINHYDCDVFFSFWKSIGHGIFKVRYDYNSNDEITEEYQNEIINLCNPKSFEFEDYKDFENKIEKERLLYHNPNIYPYCKNSLSMHYKVFKCHKLVENSGTNYDVILRLRPDQLFKNVLKFNQPEYLEDNCVFSHLTPATCCVGGMNDRVAYGNLKSMTLYSNLYNNWANLSSNKHTCVPEYILKDYLDSVNLQAKNDDSLDHYILREDGTLS